jgi:hypothetical protein
MHCLLGNLPDVTKADCHYIAYSDAGLFGNYFFGNEVFTRQMNYCGVHMPTIYAHYLNEVEVIRGRNHLYNFLLTLETADSLNKEIGQQMCQLGRRVPRSEVVKRIAYIDSYHLKHIANKWFYDAEPGFTNWGPIETVSHVGSYKYFKINTMSTVTKSQRTIPSVLQRANYVQLRSFAIWCDPRDTQTRVPNGIKVCTEKIAGQTAQ